MATFLHTQGNQLVSVYSSTVQVLACDVQLAPGDIVSFAYREKIPDDGPPSYRGTAVKYGYVFYRIIRGIAVKYGYM